MRLVTNNNTCFNSSVFGISQYLLGVVDIFVDYDLQCYLYQGLLQKQMRYDTDKKNTQGKLDAASTAKCTY